MRILFILALIGWGVYQFISPLRSLANLDQFHDFWDIWKYVYGLAIIGIITREIVQARHRAKWPDIYRINRAEPINHNG